MLKRSSLLALGIVALAVPWLSDPGAANQPNNPPPAPAIPAFTAGRAPALLFRNSKDGTLRIVPMIDGQLTDLLHYDIDQVPTDWKVIGTGDFNNDGHGDILWRNNSGQLAIWEMAGTGLKNSPPTTTVPKLPGLTEKPFVADFNGDGISDLLWQGRSFRPSFDPLDLRSNSLYTYLSQTWTMAAGTTTPASTQSESSISTWTAAGGQFGGDGGIDRFLRSSDGRTFFALSGGAILPGPNVAAEWEVKAVGDFNGDGTSDLLWQNRDSGTVSIWQVRNGTYVTSPFTNYVPLGVWQVLGAADMDGDGVSDIIWRNNNGQVSVWLMSNYGIKGTREIMTTTDWEFAGILNTKTRLGEFQVGTKRYVKSSSLCVPSPTTDRDQAVLGDLTYTITGPLPEKVSRSFKASVNPFGFDPTTSLCYNTIDHFVLNIAGDYRLEAGDLGGFNFTIKAGLSQYFLGVCPDKAICSKPTAPPPPPPPPEQFSRRYLVGQPCGPLGCSFRPYFLYDPFLTGTLKSFRNPSSTTFGPGITINFVKSGFTTDDCGKPSAVVTLPPGQTTTDIMGIYGNSKQKLPVRMTACITAPLDTDTVPIDVGITP
jgi:hypothetical protein